MIKETEVLIIGSGVAGLYFALNLDKKIKVTIVSKGDLRECNSYLAQGGISKRRDFNDTEAYFEDTMKAGLYKNNIDNVRIMIEESENNIDNLLSYGVPFDRSEGKLDYTKEGAHSDFRIVHCKDKTGEIVTDTLIREAKNRDNIKILENVNIIDLISMNNKCYGATGILNNKKEIIRIYSNYTILASGGIGGLFKNSTNQRNLTGIGLALAIKHNIDLCDIGFIQFHPTALYEQSEGKKFLISESLRGEGGKLVNINNEKFACELLPRNILTKAILEEEKNTRVPYVLLDVTHLGEDFIKSRFPGIYSGCLEKGIDITKEKVRVTPVQHYFMGGINVDSYTRTSMKNLFSCGECSCTGVHGENRLASNSLLEALVFSKRGAEFINKNMCKTHMVNFISHIKNFLCKYSYEEAIKEDKKNTKLAIEKIKEVRRDIQDELVYYR